MVDATPATVIEGENYFFPLAAFFAGFLAAFFAGFAFTAFFATFFAFLVAFFGAGFAFATFFAGALFALAGAFAGALAFATGAAAFAFGAAGAFVGERRAKGSGKPPSKLVTAFAGAVAVLLLVTLFVWHLTPTL